MPTHMDTLIAEIRMNHLHWSERENMLREIAGKHVGSPLKMDDLVKEVNKELRAYHDARVREAVSHFSPAVQSVLIGRMKMPTSWCVSVYELSRHLLAARKASRAEHASV